ncbi:MAG: CHAD domain-containing protein [Sulfurovaceae bacterium]|nr:CHAD domain-containing protein [Sulfurovaceae bacterium]
MKPIIFDPLEFMKNTLSVVSKEIDEPSISKDKKIHSIRVMSKKLRSLLYLVKPSLENKELFKIQKQFYKDLSKTLSEDREIKVMHDTFVWVVKKCKLSLDDYKDIQTSLQKNIENKTIAGPDIDQKLEICKQSILMALDNFDILKKASDPKKDWHMGFHKTYEKAYYYLNLALVTHDVKDIHMFRRYAKYHMYQIQLLTDHIKHLKKREQKLDKLTSMLGRYHDLTFFEDYLHNNKNLKSSEILLLHIIKEHRRLAKKALKLATDIFEHSPKKFKLFNDKNHKISC